MDTTGVKGPEPDWTNRTTLTVTEAASLLGIGRSAAYDAVHAGQIPSLRIGKRLIVPVAALRALLEGRDC